MSVVTIYRFLSDERTKYLSSSTYTYHGLLHSPAGVVHTFTIFPPAVVLARFLTITTYSFARMTKPPNGTVPSNPSNLTQNLETPTGAIYDREST